MWWPGAALSQAPESVRKYLGLCLFSQAGVAIGLSLDIYYHFQKIPAGSAMGQWWENLRKKPTLHRLCVVDENGRLLGLINRKRGFKYVFLHHLSSTQRVSKLLTLLLAETPEDLIIKSIVKACEDQPVEEVVREMLTHNIRKVPVVDEEGKEWLKEEA